MILADDAELAEAIQGHNKPGYTATAWYLGAVTVADVPLHPSGSLSFDGNSEVQGRGSAFVMSAGDTSLVPESKTSPLASFGQELAISRTITSSSKTWTVPLGRFRISEVPSTKNYFRMFPSRANQGWEVKLDLDDRFEALRADDFLEATGPAVGKTVWDEVSRLAAPFPVVRTVVDAAVPAGTEYRSRIGAITTLLDIIGHVPHMTREGAITGRLKDRWLTETEPDFVLDGVIEWGDGMSNSLFNQVQVSSSKDSSLVRVRRITDMSNPIAVGRMGGRTFKHSSPIYTSQYAVDQAADTILARVSTRDSQIVTIRCLPDPRLELGDVGLITDTLTGKQVLGEIQSMSFSLNPLADMSIDLIVAEVR